ncbi:hypothetical protein BSKO_13264 [Bryopsis sp. KO-2023]|nr:hypothetical protein BSKO_13264 [Bryopsis sp. KO-2023]
MVVCAHQGLLGSRGGLRAAGGVRHRPFVNAAQCKTGRHAHGTLRQHFCATNANSGGERLELPLAVSNVHGGGNYGGGSGTIGVKVEDGDGGRFMDWTNILVLLGLRWIVDSTRVSIKANLKTRVLRSDTQAVPMTQTLPDDVATVKPSKFPAKKGKPATEKVQRCLDVSICAKKTSGSGQAEQELLEGKDEIFLERSSGPVDGDVNIFLDHLESKDKLFGRTGEPQMVPLKPRSCAPFLNPAPSCFKAKAGVSEVEAGTSASFLNPAPSCFEARAGVSEVEAGTSSDGAEIPQAAQATVVVRSLTTHRGFDPARDTQTKESLFAASQTGSNALKDPRQALGGEESEPKPTGVGLIVVGDVEPAGQLSLQGTFKSNPHTRVSRMCALSFGGNRVFWFSTAEAVQHFDGPKKSKKTRRGKKKKKTKGDVCVPPAELASESQQETRPAEGKKGRRRSKRKGKGKKGDKGEGVTV